MISKIYLGDEGTKIILDAGSSLATQSVLKIKYIKPDGSSGQWNGQLDTDNNRAYYITITNDIDQIGLWYFQLYAEITSWKGHGEMVKQRVYEPIAVT